MERTELLEKPLHIDVLKLLAVKKALAHFQKEMAGKVVRILSDRSTVVSYINQHGGT